MKNIQIGSSGTSLYTTEYKSFKGVDFSCDATQVDRERSPYALNLVSDGGGFPEKRLGWRVLYTVEQPVNGLFFTVIGGNPYYIVHGGTKLYKFTKSEAPTVISSGIENAKSTAFTMKNRLWILTGGHYIVYDGTACKNAADMAYVPTTVISREPTGGGKAYEEINMLTKWQKNSFVSDGAAKIYTLNRVGLDSDAVAITVNGANKAEGTDFTVNRATGKVTFTAAPAAPAVTGQDNVIITFAKTTSGYAGRIINSTISVLYGVGTNDRVFVSGNADYRNYDWYSGLSDPSYFPDVNYSVIGSDNTAIMGYHKIGQYLAVIKEDNSNDSTIFLRSADMITLGDEQKAAFPLKQGITGVGAISQKSFGTLMDEPLFLSRTGIYGIVSSAITAEKTVQNRSCFVDSRLLKEANLKTACAVEWNGFYILAVDGRCYVLDGKQQKTYKAQATNYVYECYYWDNVPAVCFLEQGGVLFFGTADGRICRFNTDISTMARYNDNGDAIKSQLYTKADDDGDFMSLKTMQKKGCGVMIKPYTRSSCTVYARTDRDFGKKIRHENMDILDFNDVDFSRFTFNTNDSPQVIPFKTRVKKYKTLQFILENDVLNEGFGIFGVIKRFTKGGYVKR